MSRLEALSVILIILGLSSLYLSVFMKLQERRTFCPDGNGLGYTNDSIVRGLAYDDYFCVYSAGLTITEALQVCTHEYAHTNLGLDDPEGVRFTAKGIDCTCK